MSAPGAKFYITIHSKDNSISGIVPFLANRGTPLGADPNNPDGFVLGSDANFVGFLTRDNRLAANTSEILTPGNLGGITLEDIELGRTSPTPVGMELPYVVGQEATAQKAREIEVEGPGYIMLSGTGAIASNTTVPQDMTLDVTGRWRIRQANEHHLGTLIAVGLPPVNDGLGDLRVRIQVTQGG
jgi:hypothetical protein